ncbi:hypothetical protein GN244_ATG14226 [Phytophthora infestans]|uniref:Uncharacterized protein n=1 Tax=Phytophthora infestans TaxID=4787 RepID=A0A833VYC1_PHYIN|nr:hypothetical protein GN244_ATG14226 [Phytophthora infestans]KAF4148361.1 hypothetical protein GN958_ATG02450 [Phytophthora infestans]
MSTDWRSRLKRLREVHEEEDADEAAETVLVLSISACTNSLHSDEPRKKRGGSRSRRSPNTRRDHASGH